LDKSLHSVEKVRLSLKLYIYKLKTVFEETKLKNFYVLTIT